MLSAPEAFMAVANATAEIVEKAPPFVTYRVHGIFHAAGEGMVDRTITVRTDDGVAVVHDDATGKDELRPPFPASPAFDALSTFKLQGELTLGTGKGLNRYGDMRITNVLPLHYAAQSSHADAVARAVKGYVVTYADDAAPALGHVHLERNAVFGSGERWLRDVWYDPATMLPTRVLWGGSNDFTLDSRYAVFQGRWLLRSIAAGEVVHAPLWLGRMTIAISGAYDAYQFSDVAPDARLAPTPSASPQPEPSPKLSQAQ